MPTCFVIQPFDSGKYDKRFEQVFKPAIIAAGLEPYRVDQDTRVSVPIESIESGIREANVCLADITADNPNVWYELGYAFAAKRPVLMVCSMERWKYPFDIQHRAVVSYTSEAPEDFKILQEKITARLEVLNSTGNLLQEVADREQVAPVAGLTQSEVAVLVAIASEAGVDDGKVGIWSAKQASEKAGQSSLGFALGLRRLKLKAFVQTTDDQDFNGNFFDALQLTAAAWDWIDAHESMFLLKRESRPDSFHTEITDEDIPF